MPSVKSCSKFGEIQDDIASEVLTLLVYLCHLAVFQKLPLYALFIHSFNILAATLQLVVFSREL